MARKKQKKSKKEQQQEALQQKYEAEHRRNLNAYQRQIDEIYREAAEEAASISSLIGDFNPEKAFSFKDYPITRNRVTKLLSGLKNNIEVAIVNGIRSEWTLANNKNNELSRLLFGDRIGYLTEDQYSRYFSSNQNALDSFLTRKRGGLGLSDRVWKYTDQFKEEIEMTLDLGLRDGVSASEMAKSLKDYLQHPDKLFRRVRDEHGILHLSKAASAYHPGQGVNRSSFKNARRLAATETNIAYRTADYNRYQGLDFVVGIHVILSNNHTLNGMPFEDICDILSGKDAEDPRGRYPKDFMFTGWHPLCRCHVLSILKTREEMDEDNRRIMAGEGPSTESVNSVNDVPDEFKKWIEDNKERAERSFSVPYFVSDNPQHLPPGYKDLYGMKMPYASYAEYEKAMKFNKKYANFSDEIKANNRELSKELPVMQGKIMNFSEADGTRPNPFYFDSDALEKGYYHNCQTCTMALELRRRGFPVMAAPNPLVGKAEKVRDIQKYCREKHTTWEHRFLTSDGKKAEYSWSSNAGIKDAIEDKRNFIEGLAKDNGGRYEVYCAWKSGNAHVFTIERQKNGNLLWYDPQNGKCGGSSEFEEYLEQMQPGSIGVMRIDDKLINPKFAGRFLKSL